MNKQRFIDYLRSPERLTEGQFSELQKLLIDYPYFTIAKSIAARAAKDLDMPEKNGLIASAAIYATDRKHLKKYINGELVFLAAKPVVEDSSPIVEAETAAIQSPEVPPTPIHTEPIETSKIIEEAPASGEVDQIIDELHRDIDELKKSRMHFVDIQNQIDEEAANASKRSTRKENEQPEASSPAEANVPEISEKEPAAEPIREISTTAIPKPIVAEEKPKEPKPAKEAPIKFDLDALKRELAREEEEKENKTAVKESTKPKEKAPRAKRVREDNDEDLKEPPPVVNVPGSITNMSPAEENDEDEDTDVKLPRKKSARKPRKPMAKIKREDLEKVLGKKITSSQVPKVEKEEAKAPLKKDEVKPEETPVATAPKEKEPKAVKPKKEKITEPIAEKTVVSPQVEKAPAPEPPVVKEEVPSAPMAKETDTPPPPVTREEEPFRNSIRAFLDFGTSVERASVSRASSSRSKRSARANRTRPSDEGAGDGKGDDESGGARSLIDKFIQENPSIQRRPSADDKADLSEDSTKWNPELASEYLAKIYLDQGNTKRAILIYETLSLKFPEKKSYFAGLIEKLKK